MPCIIVARLVEWIDPWEGLRLRVAPYFSRAVPPIEAYRGDPGMNIHDQGLWRTAFYHRGRVLHFAEVLAAGEEVDPISVDCECDRHNIYPVPVLLDGYHRLAGAVLAGAENLPAVYGGRVDLLNYLTGKRRNRPHE